MKGFVVVAALEPKLKFACLTEKTGLATVFWAGLATLEEGFSVGLGADLNEVGALGDFLTDLGSCLAVLGDFLVDLGDFGSGFVEQIAFPGVMTFKNRSCFFCK